MGTMEEFAFPPTAQETKDDSRTSTVNNSASASSNAAPPPKLKSCFRRRKSVTATDEDRPQLPQAPPSTNGQAQKPPEPKPQERNPIVPLNLVPTRICGPSRSRCGYCGGTRLHVLGVDDGSNVVLSIQNSSDTREGGRKVPGTVDEEGTSKSYGLLFDYLPYETYQKLIDRGWRRSGKHLYRPHNFESCCPAISIRLDTTKFSSLYSTKSSKPKSAIENSVLVGGSKSQKRVGRNLLRALEAYNAKITASKKPNSSETDVNFNSPGCEYAFHVAKMKLAGDSISGSEDGEVATDSKHVDKKSRQASPAREEDGSMEGVTAQNRSNAVASTKFVLDKQTLSAIEESEHQLLRQLSQITYQTITKQVMKALESAENVSTLERPKWAWWDDDKSADYTNTPKWCLLKFLPASQATCKGGDTYQTNTIVVASTVACAAASGRSRGLVDKARLGTAVVETLKVHLSDLRSEQSKLCMQNVVFHEKSGQIQIVFKLTPHFLSEIALSKSKSKPIPAPAKVPIEEPFSEFLLRCQNDMTYQPAKNTSSAPNKGFSSQHQLFLVVRSVPVFESSIQPEVHQLFCKYQSSIHGDDNPYLCDASISVGEGSEEYRFYLQKGSAGFLDIDATYGHLSAAQRSKIKKSYLSFYRFLCETPLKHEAIKNNALERNGQDTATTLEDGYDISISRGGTFHQQYRLCTSEDSFDGPLIAVGVVDILPSCLSSVYAFYDPILSQLELGKYTALREIEFVRRANLGYYYLGYYIHSCQKMIYKAEYKPSELLCPVYFKWVDFEVAKKRLEKKSPIRHCCALYESEGTDSPDKQRSTRIENIVLDIGDNGVMGEMSLLNVRMLSQDGRKMIDPIITEFANEVGPELSRMLMVKLS